VSGRQLFGIDKFRDTGRSLLSILADPNSIFIKGLAQFQQRSLYANVVNDRTVTYYTAGISQTDPFVKPENVKMNYISGYDDVILDGEHPVSSKEPRNNLPRPRRPSSSVCPLSPSSPSSSPSAPLSSSQIPPSNHSAAPSASASTKPAKQASISNNTAWATCSTPCAAKQKTCSRTSTTRSNQTTCPPADTESEIDSIDEKKRGLGMDFPTLALTQDQFGMIEALDHVGFKKHPVYIHNHRHSHAAIIVRIDKKSFDEGRVVIRHWLDHFAL
jgi:hypothetical protein